MVQEPMQEMYNKRFSNKAQFHPIGRLPSIKSRSSFHPSILPSLHPLLFQTAIKHVQQIQTTLYSRGCVSPRCQEERGGRSRGAFPLIPFISWNFVIIPGPSESASAFISFVCSLFMGPLSAHCCLYVLCFNVLQMCMCLVFHVSNNEFLTLSDDLVCDTEASL